MIPTSTSVVPSTIVARVPFVPFHHVSSLIRLYCSIVLSARPKSMGSRTNNHSYYDNYHLRLLHHLFLCTMACTRCALSSRAHSVHTHVQVLACTISPRFRKCTTLSRLPFSLYPWLPKPAAYHCHCFRRERHFPIISQDLPAHTPPTKKARAFAPAKHQQRLSETR